MHYRNRVFSTYLFGTGTYRVQTSTGNLYQYRPVHTGTYCVCTKIMSCMLDTNRGTIQYRSTTAHMSHTHSIVSHRHMTQNSIDCNIFVNTVHTSMYQVHTLGKLYVLGTYLGQNSAHYVCCWSHVETWCCDDRCANPQNYYFQSFHAPHPSKIPL